jgi:hypothetical protein
VRGQGQQQQVKEQVRRRRDQGLAWEPELVLALVQAPQLVPVLVFVWELAQGRELDPV